MAHVKIRDSAMNINDGESQMLNDVWSSCVNYLLSFLLQKTVLDWFCRTGPETNILWLQHRDFSTIYGIYNPSRALCRCPVQNWLESMEAYEDITNIILFAI